MTLHQVTAVSYDYFQLGLVFLIFSFCLSFMTLKKILLSKFVIFLILILLLLLARPGYYAMLLLPFFVSRKQLGLSIKKYAIMIISFLSISIIMVAIFTITVIHTIDFSTAEPLVNAQKQTQIIIRYPIRFLGIMVNSLDTFARYYIEGMIGNFGWLDYKLNYLIYLLFIGGLSVGIYSLSYRKNFVLTKIQQLILLCICIGTATFLHLSQYWGTSVVAARFVSGVQGRYFLPILPFGVMLTSYWIKLLRYSKKSRRIVLIVIFFYVIVSIIKSINLRYYDFSVVKSVQSSSNPIFAKVESLDFNTLLSTPVIKPIQYVAKDLHGVYIQGFQLLIRKNQQLVATPYRYKIMDSACKTTLKSDFLDQIALNSNQLYTETFEDPIRINGGSICIVIEPFMYETKNGYIEILQVDNQFLLNITTRIF